MDKSASANVDCLLRHPFSLLYSHRITLAWLAVATVSSRGGGTGNTPAPAPGSGSYTMLGRISARAGVRRNNSDTPEGEQAIGVKKAFRLLRRIAPPTAPDTGVAQDLEETPNRFEPVKLSQIEPSGKRLIFAERQPGDRTQSLRRPGDAAAVISQGRKKRVARTSAGRLFDRTLLAVEVAGALVVAWLAFQYIYTVYIDTGSHRLAGSGTNTLVVPQANKATHTPTAAPTSTRFVEVLPPMTGDGPDDGTGSAPAGKATPTSTSTPEPSPTATIDPQLLLPTRLRIPVMFLDSPVHEVTINLGEWQVSEMDIGHHEGTGNPGQTGNMVLAGHRDINSALFRELDRLTPGDEVFVSNQLGEYRYLVQDIFEVSPDEIWVMEPTENKQVTLITCTPIGLATRRLVVVAVLDETQ